MRLCKIGREQDVICKVCNKEDEGILHLFLFCEKLKKLFIVMKEIVNDLRDREEDFSWNRIFILGLNEETGNKKVINLLLVIAKSAIWKRRNVAKN